MALPPVAGITQGVSFTYRALSFLFSNIQVSVLAFGAESVGKSVFLRRLQARASLAEIFAPTSTPGVDIHSVHVNPFPEQSATIKLSYTDIGGQKDYYRVRESQLNEGLPLSILLFLDHKGLDRIHDKRGKDGEQIDENGTLDPERMVRHHEVFSELIDIFRRDRSLRNVCRAFIICLNKYDLWRDRVKKDEFLEEFRADINELVDASGIRKVPDLIPCSIKTGDGVSEILHAILRVSGWEIIGPWGLKIRSKTGVIG